MEIEKLKDKDLLIGDVGTILGKIALKLNELIDAHNKQKEEEKILTTMIDIYYGTLNAMIDDNKERDKKINKLLR